MFVKRPLLSSPARGSSGRLKLAPLPARRGRGATVLPRGRHPYRLTIVAATIPVPAVTNPSDVMENEQLTVQRALAGDQAAMRALWTRHAPHIDVVVRRLVGHDPDLAADIAQEVWIQIFRALPSFRGDAQFGTWAHRIAVNRTLNALRRTRRMASVEVDVEDDTATVEPEGERALLAASIEEAAAKLSPGARTVFLLHDVEGYTHEEIAAELGITAGGSKSQLFKARAKLRVLLAHLVDAPANTKFQPESSHVAPLY
jgi:RNA polymerase sigma-70 factor (ECF subfamily)